MPVLRFVWRKRRLRRVKTVKVQTRDFSLQRREGAEGRGTQARPFLMKLRKNGARRLEQVSMGCHAWPEVSAKIRSEVR